MMLHRQNGTEHCRNNTKPRVLVVGPIFPEGGGVGKVNSILLASRLSDQFEMMHLDTGRTGPGEGKEGTWAAINFYYFFSQCLRLLSLLIARRPQILHQSVTDGVALWKESAFMLLARMAGVKVVAHLHGPRLEAQLCGSHTLQGRLAARALHIPHVVLVLSEYWRTLLSERVSSHLNVVVIPNSVDTSIAEAMDRSTEGHQMDGRTILFLGWVGARKGVLDALRAVPLVRQQVPGVRFVFAGALDPESQQTVRQACEAARMEGNVSFPGLVTGGAKLALLAEADVFILPSHHENLPVAILEAMAMGLPVVATPVGGVPELIEDGCGGFLIRPGDYEALADRILDLLRDPELRHRMGRFNSMRVRQNHAPDAYASRMASLYQSLIARHPTEENGHDQC
jgi:glycosyltransferase involved in cell wall biosynthesis